jgi:Sulfotransferase domain
MSNWPNLFVAGVGRGATTLLWRSLAEHPSVYMSRLKEPHFFSPRFHRNDPIDQESYLALFEGATTERWRGEASVTYFWDQATPGRIRAVSPEARIVISLRDPTERAYSSYWFHRNYLNERRTFAQAVDDELATRAEDRDPRASRMYVTRGFYTPALSRYLDTFGKHVHVLFFEELVADVRAQVWGVFRFLEVDPSVADRLPNERRNPSYAPRSGIAARLESLPRGLRRLVPSAIRARALGVLMSSDKPTIEPEVRDRLDRLYAADRQEVEQLLGRIAPW